MTVAQLSRVTPEVLDTMVELLPKASSLRDISAITGLRLEVVRREAAPFLAIMKLNGTHPQCGCGKDRFHPYGCVDLWPKRRREGIVPGWSPIDSALLLARRAAIVERMVAGDRYVDIDKAMGLPRSTSKNYAVYLTPEQRALRAQAQRDRGPVPRAKPIRSNSHAD